MSEEKPKKAKDKMKGTDHFAEALGIKVLECKRRVLQKSQ